LFLPTQNPARRIGDRIIVGSLPREQLVVSGWKFGKAEFAGRIRSRVVSGNPSRKAVHDLPVEQLDVGSRKRFAIPNSDSPVDEGLGHEGNC